MARHTGEKLSFMNILIAGNIFLTLFFNIPYAFLDWMGNLAISLPFSRKAEREADYIGLMLMAQACFDPSAAVIVWKRMAQLGVGEDVNPFLSTHPANQERIQNIEAWLDEAQQARQRSDCQKRMF